MIQGGPKPSNRCLYKSRTERDLRQKNRGRHTDGSHVKTEAGAEAMQSKPRNET